MLLGARCRLFLFVSLLPISIACSPITAAQDPIRVETNQVVVPAFVVDKDRTYRFWKNPGNIARALLAGDMKRVDTISEGIVIRGLTAADFHVFDDGKEQVIQSVSYERSVYWDVRDNGSHHTEYIGPGGGKWSTAEWPPGGIGDIEPPHYLVAYALPESPQGSCHKIELTVNGGKALVMARSEYCNTKHPASDPVNGTRLGGQLENALASPKNGNVDIAVVAVPLYSSNNADLVHIAIDWPSESLRGKSRTRGVLGTVSTKDGTLVARFSDFADREGIGYHERPELSYYRSDQPDMWPVENRYERQLTLPPGEYDLRIVLGDGTRFGSAEIPLAVDGYDKTKLALSGLSLCQRISDVAAYSSQNRPTLPGAWGQKLPASYEPLMSRDVEFKPTGNTHFKKGGTLYAYFEIYEPLVEGQSPTGVQIKIRIVDLKTGEAISDAQPISAAPYIKAGTPIIPVGRGMDISKLPKGSYRLDVQANDSAGKSTPWRTASFSVE
jgi:hypothetical protein